MGDVQNWFKKSEKKGENDKKTNTFNLLKTLLKILYSKLLFLDKHRKGKNLLQKYEQFFKEGSNYGK